MKKNEIFGMKSVAYASMLGGLEVKAIEYGINDYMLFVTGAWHGQCNAHKRKINYTASGRAYVTCRGYRCYLDEIIRM